MNDFNSRTSTTYVLKTNNNICHTQILYLTCLRHIHYLHPFLNCIFEGCFSNYVSLSMNEYSLKDVDTKDVVDHVFETERDIFDYLEYGYVDPWLR